MLDDLIEPIVTALAPQLLDRVGIGIEPLRPGVPRRSTSPLSWVSTGGLHRYRGRRPSRLSCGARCRLDVCLS